MTRWTQSNIDTIKHKLTVIDYTSQPNNRSILVKENTALLKRVRQKMKHEESDLQINCVKNFRLIYPRLKQRLFSIPNGGYRNALGAELLNAEGSMPGVLDLLLAIPRKGFGGMFIEMKAYDGRLSDYQVQFIKEMQADYYCVVCRSVEQFLKEVEEYLKLKYVE